MKGYHLINVFATLFVSVCMCLCGHLVPLIAEVAGPQLGSVVHLTETQEMRETGAWSNFPARGLSCDIICKNGSLPKWVEHSTARGATAENWLVLDRRQVRSLLEGAEKCRHGDYHSGCLKPTGRPHVPAESHAITLLILGNVLWEGSHDFVGWANTLLGRRRESVRVAMD